MNTESATTLILYFGREYANGNAVEVRKLAKKLLKAITGSAKKADVDDLVNRLGFESEKKGS